METFLFWIFWGLASMWVLRRFYFVQSAVIADRLRIAALIIETGILGLFFFPFMPAVRGSFTGWDLALQGNAGIIVFLALVATSTAFLLMKKRALLKAGAGLHILNTIIFFAAMMVIFPETITLTFHDVAPIIIALLMLINTVVVLLLLQQLQKQKRRKI